MTGKQILLQAIQDIVFLIKKYQDCVGGWKDINNPSPQEYDEAINYLIDIVEIVGDDPIMLMLLEKYEELSNGLGRKDMVQ